MTTETYKEALRQAKADLAEQVELLGKAQKTAETAEKAIVELRQTISALQRLCGEPEFVEEDALGLTDAIRMAFKTQHESDKSGMYNLAILAGRGMDAHEVRTKLESMGYGGRWGNLLASIHTVIKRLHAKGELTPTGNVNGRDTYQWNYRQGTSILGAMEEALQRPSLRNAAKRSTPEQPEARQFIDRMKKANKALKSLPPLDGKSDE